MYVFSHICLVSLAYLGHGSYGQPPIDMYATGGLAAFQSGPNHYTVFTANLNPRDALIVCSSTHLASEVRLMKDEDVIKIKTDSRGIQLQIPVNETIPGRYTCVGKFSTMTKNGAFINLTISTDIFINFTSLSTPYCGTSAGSYVFNGELITMFCYGRRVSWQGQPGINLETVLIESADLSDYSCINPSRNESFSCELSVNVSMGQINVTISPTQFFSNGSDMEFVCQSSPHRSVYWSIYGMMGNLLDLNNVEVMLVAVSTNITIYQTETGSTLHISESVIRGNGIHTVLCYTYDTVTKVATSTDIGTTTNKMTTSTASDVAFFVQWSGAIILSVLASLLIFCLAVNIVFLILRHRKRTSKDQERDDPNIEIGQDEKPELHPNPAYESVNNYKAGDRAGEATNDNYEYAYVDQKT